MHGPIPGMHRLCVTLQQFTRQKKSWALQTATSHLTSHTHLQVRVHVFQHLAFLKSLFGLLEPSQESGAYERLEKEGCLDVARALEHRFQEMHGPQKEAWPESSPGDFGGFPDTDKRQVCHFQTLCRVGYKLPEGRPQVSPNKNMGRHPSSKPEAGRTASLAGEKNSIEVQVCLPSLFFG